MCSMSVLSSVKAHTHGSMRRDSEFGDLRMPCPSSRVGAIGPTCTMTAMLQSLFDDSGLFRPLEFLDVLTYFSSRVKGADLQRVLCGLRHASSSSTPGQPGSFRGSQGLAPYGGPVAP